MSFGTHSAGQILLCALSIDGNPTVDVDTVFSGEDWQFRDGAGNTGLVSHSASSVKGGVLWKVAESGSEQLRFTSSSEASSHLTWVINPITNPVVVASVDNTWSGANPNGPSLSLPDGARDALWITVYMRDNQATPSNYPTNYSQGQRFQAGSSSGGAAIAAAERELNAASEDPGAFTVGVEQFILFTIAIYDAPASDETGPTMTGAITVSEYTEGGGAYTVDWPAATDNVGVTGYEISLNNGSSWTDLGNVLTYSATGRTPGTTDQIRVRAYDAAANVAATPLSLDLLVGGRYIDALSFKSNGVAESDVKLIWANSTGDMPPRTAHLTIHWSKYRQQTGYYANWWTMPNLSSSYTDITGDYFSGYHPYPCDGLVDPDGTPTNPTSSSGTEHYYEIAGLPNTDIIGNAADESLETIKGVWVASAHYVYEDGSNTVHVYYPDLFGNPSFFITATQPTADVTGDPKVTSARALMFGANTWTVTGSANAETASGEFRGIGIYDITVTGPWSVTDMQNEATARWNSTNAPGTTVGAASVWYINDDPTSTDVTDKSGEGHDPTWGTSYRPDDYQEIVEAVGGTTQNLAADAAAQAAGTAALSLAKTLGAAGAAQAGATAALLKGVSLAAAGVANASASAAIAHGVPLSASAAAVASAGAELALAITLGANALAQAAAVAGLELGKPLAATGAAQASGNAGLQVTSGAELAAAAQAQAGGSAVLSLVVGLSAVAVAQAQASAALALGKPLAAAGTAQASGTAALQASGSNELAASAVAQASAGATLALDVPLSAAALAQAAAAGSLTVVLVLAADALAQASGSGALVKQVFLQAGASAVSASTALLQVVPENVFTADGRSRFGPSRFLARESRIGRPVIAARARRLGVPRL